MAKEKSGGQKPSPKQLENVTRMPLRSNNAYVPKSGKDINKPPKGFEEIVAKDQKAKGGKPVATAKGPVTPVVENRNGDMVVSIPCGADSHPDISVKKDVIEVVFKDWFKA